jgi:carbonic anhydrase
MRRMPTLSAPVNSATSEQNYLKALPKDIGSGLVVFLVALPLCLGIALASNAPLMSGLVAGVVGGLLVAWLSGSHTSVSGPAAGLTAVVIVQIETLGGFNGFLVAVVIAGAFQIGLGAMRAGSLAAFFPSSVIKGLLAAIGVILILKQIPHLFGHDPDWMGDMDFVQTDGENTFTELVATIFDIHPGAAIIGLVGLLMLIFWNRTPLVRTGIPAPLGVVLMGIGASYGLEPLGEYFDIGDSHSVAVPVTSGVSDLVKTLPQPDWAVLKNPAVYLAAMTIAVVASLETLLNLEAVDKLDTKKRVSPPNRELLAQGVGNMTSGLLGGLPITSVIVRSSVNVASGGQTRVSCFIHGVLLFSMVALFPGVLNRIPLAALAAILLHTGFKLANPALFKQMWREGTNQFLPFVVTIAAIILTDLLVGILIGMAVSIGFILRSNLNRPLRGIVEKHVGGDVFRLELANQVSFLNKAALMSTLDKLERGSQLVIDARNTDYIDADILDLLTDFEKDVAPARNLGVSLLGFKDHYELRDRIHYVDVTTRDVQQELPPERVLSLMKEGNQRFLSGNQLLRDPRRQIGETSAGQFPLAVVLACMDSRIATEMVFDLGLGDIFSVRLAGNVADAKALGSIEYGCAVAGARLLLIMGHTRCGAVNATIDLHAKQADPHEATGCENIESITSCICKAIDLETTITENRTSSNELFSDLVTELNVRQTMKEISEKSGTVRRLIEEKKIRIAGAVYDVRTGLVKFLDD